jgi:NitT/TauT family transport system ATP-binding protein
MTTKEKRAGVSIRLEGVSKRFASGRELFSKLDLSVESGEFLSVIGASGCGKSTLLRILSGLETIESGSISIEPAAEVAFVFQEPHLLPWRTVRENVLLPLELMKLPENEQEERLSGALESVGMAQEKGLYPSQLSGGMKMRVSLARALCTSPSLLLLDEPFAALDELSRVQLEEELRSLWIRRGMTVVLVTHSFTEAVFLSDRIVVLDSQKGGVGDSMAIRLGDRDEALRAKPEFSAAVSDCRTRFERAQPLLGGKSGRG